MATQFSIIITCCNQRHYIREAVESAFSQRYLHKEIIVVDDASTDGSQQVLEQYGEKIKLANCQSNQGASRARNLGASMATGDYLVFLDGDDVLLPWALDVYEGISHLKRPKLILGTLLYCKETIPIVDGAEIFHEIKVVDLEALVKKDRSYRGCASALVVDRQTFIDVKGWTNVFFPGEVDDLLIKLGCSGRTILICSPPTTGYRVHARNAVHQVPGFVQMMHRIVRSEQAGNYPGGPARRFERYALIGGPVFFWAKSSIRAHCYGPPLKLLASGWPMVLAAIANRFWTMIKGRRPTETLGCLTDKVVLFCERCQRAGQPCPHGVLKAD
jgi:glycosyltransferase involved in cell wall biosynthesis